MRGHSQGTRLLPLLLVGVLAGSAAAETDEQPAEPRYAVEILIFEYLDRSGSTPEIPPPRSDDGIDAPGPARPPPGKRSPVGFLLLDPGAGPPDFLALEPQQLALNGAYQRLARLDAYRPLAVLGWTQRAWPRDAAEGLEVELDAAVPPGLSGRITLFKERFLHLAVDLEFTSGTDRLQSPAGVPQPAARIVESRRLRGDEAQYFDHPRFGVIATVRELQPPVADDAPASGTSG